MSEWDRKFLDTFDGPAGTPLTEHTPTVQGSGWDRIWREPPTVEGTLDGDGNADILALNVHAPADAIGDNQKTIVDLAQSNFSRLHIYVRAAINPNGVGTPPAGYSLRISTPNSDGSPRDHALFRHNPDGIRTTIAAFSAHLPVGIRVSLSIVGTVLTAKNESTGEVFGTHDVAGDDVIYASGRPAMGSDSSLEGALTGRFSRFEAQELIGESASLSGGGSPQIATGGQHFVSGRFSGGAAILARAESARSDTVHVSGSGGPSTIIASERSASAGLSAGGALSALGLREQLEAARVGGGGRIGAAAISTRGAAAAIRTGGRINAVGGNTSGRFGAARVSGQGRIGVKGMKHATHRAALSGGGSVAAATATQREGAAGLSLSSAIAAASETERLQAAAISGGGTVSVTGMVLGDLNGSGAALVAGGGRIAVIGRAERSGQALIAGSGRVAAIGEGEHIGLAGVTGGGQPHIQASGDHAGAAALRLGGEIAVIGGSARGGAVAFSTGGGLAVASEPVFLGRTSLTTGGGIVAVQGVHERLAAPRVQALATITAVTMEGEPFRAGIARAHDAGDVKIVSGASFTETFVVPVDLRAVRQLLWIVARWPGEEADRRDFDVPMFRVESAPGETAVTVRLSGEVTAEMMGHYHHELWFEDADCRWGKILSGHAHVLPGSFR